MKAGYPSLEEVKKAREKLTELSFQHWYHDDFLTWKWWLLLTLSVLPWYLWWKIVDRERAVEILLYGGLFSGASILLDNIGTELMWWSYPDKLFQMVPPLIPADFTLVPTCMMVIYQLCGTFRAFALVHILFSLFTAFVAEPIFIWLKLYELHSWSLWYSFIFYVLSGFLFRWFVHKLTNKPYRTRNGQSTH